VKNIFTWLQFSKTCAAQAAAAACSAFNLTCLQKKATQEQSIIMKVMHNQLRMFSPAITLSSCCFAALLHSNVAADNELMAAHTAQTAAAASTGEFDVEVIIIVCSLKHCLTSAFQSVIFAAQDCRHRIDSC
jgi:hypothetical protein